MTRVREEDTNIERVVRSALHKKGYRFRKHVRDLPGKPDVVFPGAKVAVFIDGDFWHGYRFPSWQRQMSVFWAEKIQRNRERDRRNFRRLRSLGWRVIRLWQHDVEKHLDRCIQRIVSALAEAQR